MKRIAVLFAVLLVLLSVCVPTYADDITLFEAGWSYDFTNVAQFASVYVGTRIIRASAPEVWTGVPAGASAPVTQGNFTEISYERMTDLVTLLSTNYWTSDFGTYVVTSADNLNSYDSGRGWQGRTDWYFIRATCQVRKSFQFHMNLLSSSPLAKLQVINKGDVCTIGSPRGYIYVAHSNRPITNNNNFVVVDNTVTNNNTLVNYDFDFSLDDSAIVDAIDTTNSLLSRAIQAVNNVGDLQYYSNSVLGQFFNLFIQYVDGAFDSFTTQDNILFALQQFYNLFDSRFSDLDLTYFNEADIAVPRGGTLDWNEADQGNISILANDIGTLELSGFPDIDGYWVNHSLGGDISVERNDGTFFPNEWQLSGGTVTMPTIDTYYASISVSAPAGVTIEVAGNTHTFASDDTWSVNVDFGEYAISASYVDQGVTLTCSDTIVVDSYSDYLVSFSVSSGALSVSLSTQTSYASYFPNIEVYSPSGVRLYYAYQLRGGGLTRSWPDIPPGSYLRFTQGAVDGSFSVYVNNDRVFLGSRSFDYTITSDIALVLKISSYNYAPLCYITTGQAHAGAISDSVTITLNPVTSVPVTTISRLYRPADSTTWVAFDSAGEQHSFTAASNLALNRSFVSHSYSGADLLNLSNFPSGSWTVDWNGDSEYITVHFEEYSKFFLWLNRFLINFRDTLYLKMEDISVTAAGDVIVNQSGVDYTEQLDAILESLDSALSTGDYTTIVNEINNYDFSDNTVFNDIYNVDDDTTLVDVTKDGASVFGKLIRFLFDIGVRDALDSDPIGDLADFYLDETEGVDVWAS